MSKNRGTSELSAREIHNLPWPKALHDRAQPLSTQDAYDVGKLIVERVYGGAYNGSRGRKLWSLRKLQSVLDKASAATLARSIQTYQTANGLGLKPPLRNVDMGHLVRISSLQPQLQRKLLRRVEEERWGVQRLQEEVIKIRGKSSRGRPPSPGCVKALNALARHDLFSHLERIADLDARSRRTLGKRIATTMQDLRRVQRELHRHRA
ncbi:MAG TPA: hypothetical protein VHO25_00760 [Polyangiaceae bacterium]|jgi:hypothetical protein|nr:hypothetical protein [Polyangiaceae bacterium]